MVDAAWQQIDGGEQPMGNGTKLPHDYMSAEMTAKESGYAFTYISHENTSLIEFYVDDATMTYTPTNIIQSTEYYPYGLQTANSWTRDNTTGNNFLGNGGTELNTTSSLYDLDWRQYDPILGRMNGVDPMAGKYSSLSPYNFAFNDPVSFNDPSGADPLYNETTRASFGESMQGGYFKPRIVDAGNGGGGVLTNPGFSASTWSVLGPMAQSAWDAVPWENGAGTFNYSNGQLTSFTAFGFNPQTGEGWVSSSDPNMANADWHSAAGIVTSQVVNTITASNGWAHTAFGSFDQPKIGSAFNALGISLLGNYTLLQEVNITEKRLGPSKLDQTLTLISLVNDFGLAVTDAALIANSLTTGVLSSTARTMLKRLNPLGTALDLLSHGKELYNSENIGQGLMAAGKIGLDIFFLANKANPWFYAGQAAWSLYNSYEDATDYGLLNNKN